MSLFLPAPGSARSSSRFLMVSALALHGVIATAATIKNGPEQLSEHPNCY
jgi:hypothetical protein